VIGHVPEVIVGRQHPQVVTDAQLGQEGIDRSDLYPGTPTTISQLCGRDVIVSIRSQ